MFTYFVAGYMNRIETTDLFWEIENLKGAQREIEALIAGLKCPDDMAPALGADVADIANGAPADRVLDLYGEDSHPLIFEVIDALGIDTIN